MEVNAGATCVLCDDAHKDSLGVFVGFFFADLPPKWVKVVTQINRREGVVVMNTKCHGSE